MLVRKHAESLRRVGFAARNTVGNGSALNPSELAVRCDHPEAQIGIDRLKNEMRAYCERLDESLEFTSENQTLIDNTYTLFGNLARPGKWTLEDLQLEVDVIRDDARELRQKLTDHRNQMRKSRRKVVTVISTSMHR